MLKLFHVHHSEGTGDELFIGNRYMRSELGHVLLLHGLGEKIRVKPFLPGWQVWADPLRALGGFWKNIKR
jgi:hypothetical protein